MKNLTPSLLVLSLVVVVAVAIGGGDVAAAEEGAAAVPWKKLAFGAEKWFNRVETRIELGEQNAAGAAAAAVTADRGRPLETAAAKFKRIGIHTTITPALGSAVMLDKVFWFDSQRSNVLFGETCRTGREEYLRRFRFTRDGVYRFRREPVSPEEARLSPPEWSDTKASFYPYDPRKWGCRQVLAPGALIYFINRVNFDSPETSPALCVFHKRQLYRVTLRNGGQRTVNTSHRRISGQNDVEVKKAVAAARIMLEAVPLGDYRGEVEDFSFLGFKKNVELLFDPATRIPIMISGHIPNLGHSVLKLNTVHPAP